MSITKTKFLIIFLVGFFAILFLSALLIKPRSPLQTQFSASINSNHTNDQLISLRDPVIITFTKPFKLEDLIIDVEPVTVINTSADPSNTILTITPAQSWRLSAAYTIKILKSSISGSGENLKEDFVYNFQTTDH